ncbi:AAR2 protein [Ancylostoma duodenale]|uniref:Protein AAR2 homolog n=1 Tax=Ancylostoma duodenale TaxID=51022 RepID=A0A0C2FM98_9BILA|nr:AAR2 protein [Ancylostoma duodenale]
MGLKMIPAGVHFVYCSVKGAPRIGFFHNFKSEEIVVKKWDKQKETFSDEVNRFRLNLKNIDSTLGPYPFENYRSWYALTDFINGQTVERLNPLKGKISAQAELVSMETCLMENEELNATVGCSNSVDREHPVRTRFVDQQGLPIMKIRDGYEIRFLAIPQLNANENRVGIDYTDRLERVIRQLDGDWKQLLAEVQFAFACFLIGQVSLVSRIFIKVYE